MEHVRNQSSIYKGIKNRKDIIIYYICNLKFFSYFDSNIPDVIDISLIDSCRKKDRKSQEKLYFELSPFLYETCIRYVKNIPEAQDCLQETFVNIFQNIDSYKEIEDSSFIAWTKRIAINISLRSLSKNNVLKNSFELNDDITTGERNNQIISQLIKNDWWELMNQLPESKRIIFNLYVIEEYKHKEIAEMLGITIGTSKSQLFKAKELLKQMSSKLEINE